MRVVLADDSVLLREGIARLLEEAGFEVVGQADNPDAAAAEGALVQPRRRDRRHPDAADAHRRGPARRAGDPRAHPGHRRARALAVRRAEYALDLLSESAEGVGYLLKDRVSDIGEFAAAVRRVGEGGSALDPTVVSQLVGRRRERRPARRPDPARARGARADGRGPLEPGDLRPALHHAARGREARHEHLHEAPPARPTPPTTAACSPCSPSSRSVSRTAQEVRLPAPADACPPHGARDESGASLESYQNDPSPRGEDKAMSPLKKSNNIAARMGRWSASHWKTAVFGWLAFVVVAVAVGRRGRHEADRPAGRQRRPGPQGRPDPQAGRLPGRPADGDRARPEQDAHDRRSPPSARRSSDASPRSRRSRRSQEPPLAARPGTRRPGLGRRPHRHGRVRHARQRRTSPRSGSTRSPTATGKIAGRHPGFFVGEAGSISSGKALNDAFNKQLAQAGERSVPLTLIVLLFVFGALVAAGLPLLLALTAVIAHDRAARAPEPPRPDGSERQRGRAARRARRRRRLLALLPQARA